jgi:S-adenosylmethionine synthetase
MKHYFTSESVTEGHPDKMCDQISDAVLDAIYEKDPYARVACECATTTGLVIVMGQISTQCYIDIEKITRATIDEIGYNRAKFGFDAETCGVLLSINEQSGDIAMGVDKSLEAKKGLDDAFSLGAGDQGIMFGYACDETEKLMPAAIDYAHKLAKRLSDVRKSGLLNYLRPDGKTQVTVEYEDDTPKRIDTVVISAQHNPNTAAETIERDLTEEVIRRVIPENMLDEKTKYFINPTGRFVMGGPSADTGLTGRKIIVDTYGGYARHGGGAFSGKDPTKVDRSASYMARYIAKNIVAAKLARKCEIEIAYAIGVAQPVSIRVDTFGTGKIGDEALCGLIKDNFDLRPAAIINRLDLRRPIYRQTAAYGHFGRSDIDLPWEKCDMQEKLAAEAKKYMY